MPLDPYKMGGPGKPTAAGSLDPQNAPRTKWLNDPISADRMISGLPIDPTADSQQPQKPTGPRGAYGGNILRDRSKDQAPPGLLKYRNTNDPRDLSAVLREHDATIRSAARKYAGSDDPVVMGRAKKIVIDSLAEYDPKMSTLPTYLDRQLQPLMRWSSRRGRPVKVADLMQMQRSRVGQMEREWEKEHGRPPTSQQLSDYTGIPLDRISKIRQSDTQIFHSSINEDKPDTESVRMGDMAVRDDQRDAEAWISLVRDDLSTIDQYILEHTLGLDGAKVLSNSALASKLKISPGAVSQRKAKIQEVLDAGDAVSPFK